MQQLLFVSTFNKYKIFHKQQSNTYLLLFQILIYNIYLFLLFNFSHSISFYAKNFTSFRFIPRFSIHPVQKVSTYIPSRHLLQNKAHIGFARYKTA